MLSVAQQKSNLQRIYPGASENPLRYAPPSHACAPGGELEGDEWGRPTDLPSAEQRGMFRAGQQPRKSQAPGWVRTGLVQHTARWGENHGLQSPT